MGCRRGAKLFQSSLRLPCLIRSGEPANHFAQIPRPGSLLPELDFRLPLFQQRRGQFEAFRVTVEHHVVLRYGIRKVVLRV